MKDALEVAFDVHLDECFCSQTRSVPCMNHARIAAAITKARRATIEECAAALEEQADVDAHCQKSAFYPGPKYTISEASAILLPQWAAEIRRLAEENTAPPP